MDTIEADSTADHDKEELFHVIEGNSDDVFRIAVGKVSRIMNDFWTIVRYIHKSTIAKEEFKVYQQTDIGENATILSLELDVQTWWNSTLHMLHRLIQLKVPLNWFLHHLHSREGKKLLGIKS